MLRHFRRTDVAHELSLLCPVAVTSVVPVVERR